jgi:hypothetical protein
VGGLTGKYVASAKVKRVCALEIEADFVRLMIVSRHDGATGTSVSAPAFLGARVI